MRLLLVQPREGTSFGLPNLLRFEPLGLECVGAAAEAAGHEVQIVDMRLDGWRDLETAYQRLGPDAVGVACQFTTDVYPALQVAGFVRAMDPRVTLFAGGHHATLQPDDFLFDESPFDAVVIGEGELPTPGLLAALRDRRPPGEVPGVITLANRDCGFTRQPLLPDLEGLPLPARHLTARYRRFYHQGVLAPAAAVETSRGCPFDCTFCSVWVFYARRARRRSPAGIMRDLERVGERHVFFTDDIAFIHRSSYEELGRRIRDAGVERIYTAETRADLVVKHGDLFDLWRELGMKTIFLGIEKVDDAGLESVRKRTSQEKNALAIRTLRNKGITPITSFIVDPHWSERDFDRLETYLDLMQLTRPTFTILTPLPGTTLYEEYRDRIVSHNYLMYDVMHSVLPTRLPLERFYERFAGLYRLTGSEDFRWGAVATAASLCIGGYGFVVRRLIRAMRQVRDPKAYLETPRMSGPPPRRRPRPERRAWASVWRKALKTRPERRSGRTAGPLANG